MNFHIQVLPGDGIGPEVVAEGIKVLKAVGDRYGHSFTLSYDEVGGIAIDRYGIPLRPETLDTAHHCDAILFGAVGGPKWDHPQAPVRPEDALLTLRKELGLFANLRPIKVLPYLVDSSVLKPEVLQGVDMVVIRELTGGLYFGKPKRRWLTKRGWTAVDTLRYNQQEVERVLRVGFELATGRKKRLTSVDKANVLETSRLWRQVAIELSAQYPDVELEHMLADSCAMNLIQRPSHFDVIVTENTFGDILTDEAAVLVASMGLLPSASLAQVPVPGIKALGFYEPIHGSAPDIAGKGIANPIAAILSVALMLRYSLGLPEEAMKVEDAVDQTLRAGHRTADIVTPGTRKVGTAEMGDAVLQHIRANS